MKNMKRKLNDKEEIEKLKELIKINDLTINKIVEINDLFLDFKSGKIDLSKLTSKIVNGGWELDKGVELGVNECINKIIVWNSKEFNKIQKKYY